MWWLLRIRSARLARIRRPAAAWMNASTIVSNGVEQLETAVPMSARVNFGRLAGFSRSKIAPPS
jgi:hypothetical protein